MAYQKQTREEWQIIMNDFEHSGLTQTNFCQQHSIPASTFSKWRKELGLAGIQKKTAPKPIAPSFQALPMATSPMNQNQSAYHIELSLGHGITLTISSGINS